MLIRLQKVNCIICFNGKITKLSKILTLFAIKANNNKVVDGNVELISNS